LSKKRKNSRGRYSEKALTFALGIVKAILLLLNLWL
jgi:hypothetical protein